MASVLCVDPSSTTMTSWLGYSSFSKPSQQSRMVLAPLQLQTTTEMRGQFRLEGKGTSLKALRTTARAGLGCRSRFVRPKAQSSTSAPPLYHSSVQAKTKRPAQPDEKVDRTCQSSTRAW